MKCKKVCFRLTELWILSAAERQGTEVCACLSFFARRGGGGVRLEVIRHLCRLTHSPCVCVRILLSDLIYYSCLAPLAA